MPKISQAVTLRILGISKHALKKLMLSGELSVRGYGIARQRMFDSSEVYELERKRRGKIKEL